MVGETYHPKLAWTGFNLQSIDCVTDDVGPSCKENCMKSYIQLIKPSNISLLAT